MPHARSVDGTRIAYEVTGPRGAPPLLMIQGLGADRRGWVLQQAFLARRYRCITFDNRGVGRSDKPAGPYDLEVMAADAIAVLDAAGAGRAHVMGASMGGVIAQILAVRHVDRVRSLVLACTACRHHPWRRELLADWAAIARSRGMRAFVPRGLRWLVGPRARRRLQLPAQLLGSIFLGVPAASFVSQVEAILAMSDDVRDELLAIGVPTLVIVGSQDILTPVGDSEELAERIPGAELTVVPGAAHAVMVEAASTFNRSVEDFLDRATATTAVPAAPPVAFPAAGA